MLVFLSLTQFFIYLKSYCKHFHATTLLLWGIMLYTTEQQTLVNFTWRIRVETPGLEDTIGRIGYKGAGNCLWFCKDSSSSSAQSYTVSKTGSV